MRILVLSVVVLLSCAASAAESLTEIRQRYERELYERVVPFWERHALDREQGGFLCCLDREGRPYDTFKEMWLEWRAVYMFAALHNGPKGEARWLKIAEDAFGTLTAKTRRGDGSYPYRTDRIWNPIAAGGSAETFTHGFAAIASAELYKATGKEKYRLEAESCWRVFRRLWKANESRQLELGHRMIGLNVMNVFNRVFKDAYRAEADAIVAEIAKFRDAETGCLAEHLSADWRIEVERQSGRFVNPGHDLEGVSFALDHLRHFGDRARLNDVLSVCDAAWKLGWDREGGGGLVYRDMRGLPPDKTDWMLKTWWACCEAATGMLRAYELSGDERHLDAFREIDAYNWKAFRDPDHPEWFAYAPVDGRRCHLYKGNFRKGCFHLPRYLFECIEVLARLEGTKK